MCVRERERERERQGQGHEQGQEQGLWLFIAPGQSPTLSRAQADIRQLLRNGAVISTAHLDASAANLVCGPLEVESFKAVSSL